MKRLHADGLMHPHDHREAGVDGTVFLHDPAIAGLRKPLPAVLLTNVKAQQSALAEPRNQIVADPALLARLLGVIALVNNIVQ